jgi:FtsH-binding integral membrane protein
MKNPMVYYGAIALGVIALAAGAYLFKSATPAAPHHISSYAAIGVGVVLLIAGIAGMFVMKPKAATK